MRSPRSPSRAVLPAAVASAFREVCAMLPERSVLARVTFSDLGASLPGTADVVVLDGDGSAALVILVDPPKGLARKLEAALEPVPLLTVKAARLREDPVAALAEPIERLLGTRADDDTLAHPAEFLERSALHPRSGLVELDRKLGPLEPGDLVLVAGVPGVGKSSFVRHLAIENAVRRGLDALYVSLEASKERLATDILCAEARVSGARLSGKMTAAEADRVREAFARLSAAPIEIVARADVTLAALQGLAKAHASETRPTRLLLIDYLELLAATDRVEALLALNRLARRFGFPVVVATNGLVASQLRANDGRPQLSDLGTMAVHADKVLLMHREKVYEMRSDNAFVMEMHIAKNRSGPKGLVQIAYYEEFQSLANLEVTYDEPARS